jgi:27-O-demethylrifamycin SV methyltransferase
MSGAKAHYDSISEAWNFLMGDNLHYGLFTGDEDTLETATDNLISKMAGLYTFSEETKILDVGCGLGNPAFFLYKNYKSYIKGISNSPKGIEIAGNRCKENKFDDKIEFEVQDILTNTLNSGYFDLAWVMESSHLMKDKNKLISELYRVLKETGTVLLCDLVLINNFSIADIFKYNKELKILDAAFGRAKMETPSYYKELFIKNNFKDISLTDISQNVIKTLSCWKKNAFLSEGEILRVANRKMLIDFIEACDILESFFKEKILGYYIIKASK